MGCASSYAKLTSRNSIAEENAGIACAPGDSATSVCVSIISKIRSPAAMACCRFAFTRLSFFAGAYIIEQRRQERRELARRQPAGGNLLAAVPERAGHADAARAAPSTGGISDSARTTRMLVR